MPASSPWTRTGTTKARQTYNYVGTILDQTSSGAFTVNSDCTGNTTMNFFVDGEPDASIVLDVVWLDDSNGFRMVTRDSTFLISVDGKKLSGRD